MTREYKEVTTSTGATIIQYEEDGVLYSIPVDPANSDYQAYLNPVEHLTEIVPADE